MEDGGNRPAVHDSLGDVLRGYRAAARMTQEELAERSGLSVHAISQPERGVRRSPRAITVELLGEALGLDAQQRRVLTALARGRPNQRVAHTPTELPPAPEREGARSLAASAPAEILADRGPLPAGSRMPLAPNPLFVGRGDELRELAQALLDGSTAVAPGQVVAFTGLGGLGKTQLAVEFVHRYGRFFAGGVFWLSLASADEVPLQVAACAGPSAMDLAPGGDMLPLEERVERVRRAWQSAEPRLLVFDNCEDESLLETWRPTSGGCRVLVTSRRSGWSPTLGVTTLPLALLPRRDSVELLRRYRPDVAADSPDLEAICEELADLPLALHLAGSYLRAYRSEISLDGYVTELRRAAVVQHASLLGAGLDDAISPTHHVQSVAATFALCLGQLDRERDVDRVAIALLARMACMAPGEPVPRDLLAKTLEEVDPLLRADGLGRLGAVGFVEEGEGWLRLHRLLVQFVRHEKLDATGRLAVDRALIECGSDAEQGRLTGRPLMAVMPHLMEAVRVSRGYDRQLLDLCNAAGLVLLCLGDLSAARQVLEDGIGVCRKTLNSGDSGVVDLMGNLALVLWEQGDWDRAGKVAGVALAMSRKVWGLHDPKTANAQNTLGIVRHELGDLANARRLFEGALDTWERTSGSESVETASCLNNLANVLRDLGELTAAEQYHERALAIRQKIFGADHPSTAQSLNGLAAVFQADDKLDAARALAERALTILEQTVGPDHPRTACTLANLALVLSRLGERDSAAGLLFRATNICGGPSCPDHVSSARGLLRLGMVLQIRGRLMAAATADERILAIRERVLGPDHPDTVATRRALAKLAAEADGPAAVG